MNYNKVLSSISNANSAPKFGFYHIYIELDSKYRDRSDISNVNSEFKFKMSGKKDINSGINSGVVGLVEPLHNIVQLDISDIVIPNVLNYNNLSTSKRITMVINEFLSNHVTIKTSTNIQENFNMHFMFDIYPIQILPGTDPKYNDVGLDTKFLKLVPLNRTLIFKTPTSESLDELTVSFYIDNKKILFPSDVYTCDIQLGPNIKNNIIFNNDHNLLIGDTFDIQIDDSDEKFLNNIKNNIEFYEFKNISNDTGVSVGNPATLNYYNLLNNDDYISFKPSYIKYKSLLNKTLFINNIKNSKNIGFLINENNYLLENNSYSVNEINKIIDELNILNQNNKILSINSSIIKNSIDDSDRIINQLNKDMSILKQNLFKLTYKNKDFKIDIDLSFKDVLLANDEIFYNTIFYKGNNYNYLMNNESNIVGYNDSMILIRNDIITLMILKNENENNIKLKINNYIQNDYELIQNNDYVFNFNDDSFNDSAMILIPTDNLLQIISTKFNIINTVEKYTINNDNYYYNDFIFPINYYIKKYDKNNNFYVVDNVIKQYGNISYYNLINDKYVPTQHISNNLINITTPFTSFVDTVYEMPYDKERCYNKYYNITASYSTESNNFITDENRCGIVDIGLSPYAKNSTVQLPVVFIKHNNKIKINNSDYSYHSVDGTSLYTDVDIYDIVYSNEIVDKKIRYVPKNSINPYIALKSEKEYIFDFSYLSPTTVKFETIYVEYIVDDIVKEIENVKEVFSANSMEINIDKNILTVLVTTGIYHPQIKINIPKINKFFGKTLKMSSGSLEGNSIIKMGTLLNVNSYKLNYIIEKYDTLNPYVINTSISINKFNFSTSPNELEFYYPVKPDNNDFKTYKVINNYNNIIFYELDENYLPTQIVYKKKEINENIYIKNENIVKFDLNHFTNNEKIFRMFLNTEIDILNNDAFKPELFFDNNVYKTHVQLNNNIYDITSPFYNIVNDTFNTDNIELQGVVDLNFSLKEVNDTYILNYNLNNAPTFNFSFGRLYNIYFDNINDDDNFIKNNYSCVLELLNTEYDISKLPKTSIGIDCITGVSSNNDFNNKYNKFIYDDILNKNVIKLKFDTNYKSQYFSIDLRSEYHKINFDRLILKMYIKNDTTGEIYNNPSSTIYLINYCIYINGNKIQDELFKDNKINMFYTKNLLSEYPLPNALPNENVSLLYTEKLKKFRYYDDNYYDYATSKNIFNVVTEQQLGTVDIKNNKILLKKMTGRDRDMTNGKVNIYLNYYHTYYIYFTELLSQLTEYDFIVSLYLDANYDIPVVSEYITYIYYDYNTDYNKYFPSSSYNDKVIGYKIDAIQNIPNTLYYCIKINGSDDIVNGGTINISLLNIVKINKKNIGLNDGNCYYNLKYMANENNNSDLYYLKSSLSTNNNMSEIIFKNTSLSLIKNKLNNFDSVKSNNYNLTFKQLNSSILNYNKIINENIKGLLYNDIIIIANNNLNNTNSSEPSVVIINNDARYTNNVYLSSKKKYKINLNDISNYSNGYFIICCANNILDLTKIIEIKDIDYTLTKNKLIFKGSSILDNNFINLNIDKFNLLDLNDYLEFYYEFLPLNRLKVFVNGGNDDNLNLKLTKQFNIIENIKNNEDNNNLFDSTNKYYHLEKINNSIIQSNKNSNMLKKYEYKLLYNRINEEIETNNFKINKYRISLQDKTHMFFHYVKIINNENIDNVASYIDNNLYDDKYIIEYDMSTSNEFTVYKNVLYKFNNFNINKNYYIYNGLYDILTQNDNALFKIKGFFMYVIFMDNFTYKKVYYGDDDKKDEIIFNIKDNQYDLNMRNLTYHTISNRNNTFILEENNDYSKRIIALKINEGRYTLNELLSNVEQEMNNNSPFGFTYKVTNDENLTISIVDDIYNNIYIKKDDVDMLISVLNKNPSTFINTPLTKERSLKIGNKYKINYSLYNDDLNIYEDIENDIIFEKKVIKDNVNKIIYLEVDEHTPKSLYIGNDLHHRVINIYNYDNIIKFKYDNGNNITVDENIENLYENEYYLFDYKDIDNYDIEFYTDNTLNTLINIGQKNLINKTVLLYVQKNMNNICYAINNILVGCLNVINKRPTCGFKFRSDLKTVNDDLLKDKNMELYNNIKHIPTNTNVYIKKPQQLILSQKFIEFNKIENNETNYALFLYVNDNNEIFSIIKKYNNNTNDYTDVLNTNKKISDKPTNTNIIYISTLYNTINDDVIINNNFTFRFLISYDDNYRSYYKVLKVSYIHNTEPTIIVSNTDNDIVENNTVRVDNSILGDDPKSIKDINNTYNNKYFVSVYNINDNTIGLITYNSEDNTLIFSVNDEIINVNNYLKQYITDDNLKGPIDDYDNSVLSVQSTINNEVNLIYAIKYKSDAVNVSSTYFIKVIYNDELLIKHATGIYSYSNLNNEGCMLTYNNNIIWTGKNYVNSKDESDSIININISMFIINIDDALTIISKNDTLFEFFINDDDDMNFVDSIYAVHFKDTSDILCVHAHYDGSDTNNNYINFKTLNIDNFGDITIINNTSINNDTYIVDKNYNNVIISDDKKSNSNFYNNIYGIDDDGNGIYDNINTFFAYTNHSSYLLYIYTPNTSFYNIIKYVNLNSILIENGKFSLDKSHLGILNDTKTSQPINNLKIMKGVNVKNKHISTDIKNLNIKDNLNLEIINDYNNLQFYKNRVKPLNNVINSLGYFTDGTNYLGLYKEVININNELFNKLIESTTYTEEYNLQLQSLSNNVNYSIKLKKEETKYNLILNELSVFTNNYVNYINAFNLLIEHIKTLGSITNINNISYYADYYINISKNINNFNISIEDKKNTINFYKNNKTTTNFDYSKTKNDIDNNNDTIFKRVSMLDKYLISLNDNLLDRFRKSEVNKEDMIYYQNAVLKNKNIFVNTRRFKIFLTASIVDKGDITNYLPF